MPTVPTPPAKCKHTKCPECYVEWYYWAEKMKKTHKQIKCKGCGLWSIWVKR